MILVLISSMIKQLSYYVLYFVVQMKDKYTTWEYFKEDTPITIINNKEVAIHYYG